MKSDSSGDCSASASFRSNDDSSKLLSLLALASGAVAMPQTSNADAVFTDLGTNFVTIGPGGVASFLIDNLPTTAKIGFEFHAINASSRLVSGGQKAGYVRMKTDGHSFIVPAPAGPTWNQIAGVSSVNGKVGAIGPVVAGNVPKPGSFVHLYLPFKFGDGPAPGNQVYYGWIDASLSNPQVGSGPDVTIFGYAFDNTGAPLPMGAIPEPAPVGLLAIGALTFGAKGLRAWRRNRAAVNRA
jgi:hypothetical protein